MESARSKARGCPGNEEFGPEIGIRLLAKKVALDKSKRVKTFVSSDRW
jgi:hypothetical protein